MVPDGPRPSAGRRLPGPYGQGTQLTRGALQSVSLLVEIYGWYTERFDTLNLMEAGRPLEALSSG